MVTPDAPTAVDLAAASDSGVSETDNLTNVTDLQFTVSGVTSGAVVRLHHGDTVIGQATASGTSAVIATSSLTGLGDGTYGVFATQMVGSGGEPCFPDFERHVGHDRSAGVHFDSSDARPRWVPCSPMTWGIRLRERPGRLIH